MQETCYTFAEKLGGNDMNEKQELVIRTLSYLEEHLPVSYTHLVYLPSPLSGIYLCQEVWFEADGGTGHRRNHVLSGHSKQCAVRQSKTPVYHV